MKPRAVLNEHQHHAAPPPSGSPTTLAGYVHGRVNQLFRRIAGPDNDLIYWLLWALAVLVPIVVVALVAVA